MAAAVDAASSAVHARHLQASDGADAAVVPRDAEAACAAGTALVDVSADAVIARFLDVAARLDGVRFDDVTGAEMSRVQDALRKVRGRIDLCDAALLSHAARLNAEGRGAHVLDVARDAGMVTDKDAYRKARAAELLAQAPDLASALAEGQLSMAHVDTIAQHADRMDESDRAELLADQEELTRSATRLGVADFQRQMRRRRELEQMKAGESTAMREKRQDRTTIDWNAATGRFHMQVHADAATGSRLQGILDAEIARMIADGDVGDAHPELLSDRNHLRTYALLNVLSIGHQSTKAHVAPASTGVVSEVSVLIDLQTLVDELRADSVLELSNGMPIDLAMARRMACEAAIIPVVLGSNGQALDVGREQRLATRAQRRALRAMHRTCALRGCTVAFDRCEIHHIAPWETGGRTDLRNLIPLCGFHHHQVHDRGWRMHLDEQRTLHIQQPDGTWIDPAPLHGLRSLDGTAITHLSPPSAADRPPGDSDREGPPGGSGRSAAPPGAPPTPPGRSPHPTGTPRDTQGGDGARWTQLTLAG